MPGVFFFFLIYFFSYNLNLLLIIYKPVTVPLASAKPQHSLGLPLHYSRVIGTSTDTDRKRSCFCCIPSIENTFL
ncbi:hypothetical protein ASPWEDRAFT_258396 [Aspergillus wentii DTO 134E9]|uniref:Uncharacterized protein n=1 Tax=Aspergillus wentii DTO 134E9 TaxID=1073089 RepID=A0A1L9S2C8_ASPWE|nr:uncharacterized protein ASPWEDRAFT_258396 [Aspergillus wentii DTO 134E9]OJJ41307.1 hypothetical protein ASPWEDRAFT_258396 [Aspergillus wentii DTO 134E9]